ncbi:MAG: hypothetical protein EOO65_03180, partial [Methanosarcinales archaeon]
MQGQDGDTIALLKRHELVQLVESTTSLLRKPIRKKMWANNHVIQALKPLSYRPPGKSATARLHPITAKSPLLKYPKSSKPSSWTKRRKLCALMAPLLYGGLGHPRMPVGPGGHFQPGE